MSADAASIALDLFVRDGRHLDLRQWDEWLALYREDAVFWVPAWRDEDEPTSDPLREVSLIYHADRASLAERILRLRSGQSLTTMPLPRTTHLVSNVMATWVDEGRLTAEASFLVHHTDPRTHVHLVHHGRYEATLALEGETWRYLSKRVLLMNDCVSAVLDFYLV